MRTSCVDSKYWFAWIAGDVAVLMMFVVAFVISYCQLSLVMRRLRRGASSQPPSSAPFAERGEGGGGMGKCCVGGLAILGLEPLDKEGEGGELVTSAGSMPLVYFAWLVYSALLGVRVLLIYKNFAYELSEDVFLGKNTLQVMDRLLKGLYCAGRCTSGDPGCCVMSACIHFSIRDNKVFYSLGMFILFEQEQ